jgi:putative transposase
MRKEIKRDLLEDRSVQEIMLENDFLKYLNQVYSDLLKENSISTNKLNAGKKRELSIRARRLCRKSRKKLITIAAPRTVLYSWFYKEANKMYDSSGNQPEKKKKGRPPIRPKIKQYIIQMANDNPRWGYDTISDVLKLVHIQVSSSSVRNILNNAGIYPAPNRDKTQTWHEFMKTQGIYQCDFFTQHAMVWNEAKGAHEIICYYVLFFINVATRKVTLAGVTEHPHEEWMNNIVRGLSWDIPDMKYLITDNDGKFSPSFFDILKSEGIKRIKIPPYSPNLNAFAERWVRTVKESCLDHILIRSEKHLRDVMKEFILHYNHERPHQGLGGVPPEPYQRYKGHRSGKLEKVSRLNGLLNAYYLKGA